ncbi:UNVERIFIED_CONTAM: hypothetical protein PYX00_003625 [Menopon gallinae]|uniref:28S ribosomal protein S9, mitochondrial n=1 Tax=Menopon gallinae TaxID=328185 RepID=A0AAW2I0N6_9NEOP
MACFTRKQVFLELLNKNNALGISLFDRAAAIARIRNAAAAYCAQPEGQEEEQRTSRNRISIAMQNYIRKAKEFDAFMQQEQKEFEEGRKFLAKIMGRKPEDFTQQDINESIEYLLPSGLHMISARPKLVPPEELYAKRKEAQFDLSGRPYHFLFYTTKQNFSQAMHDCGVHIENLNRMIAKSKTKISPDTKFNMGSSEWKTKTQLEVLFLEKIIDAEYNKFIEAMNVLVHHPLSSQCADFITKFLNVPRAGELTKDLPVPVEISEGVFAVEEKKCRRKRCSGTVTVISPGTGNITINDKELIDAFESVGARNQIFC